MIDHDGLAFGRRIRLLPREQGAADEASLAAINAAATTVVAREAL